MSLVPAICPQCGGTIEVDNSQEAGVCKYCNTPFITEKAIHNYNNTINIDNATINVSGVSVDNLNARAKQFESEGDIEKAIEYYNRVLDIDINNETAKRALEELVENKNSVGGFLLTASQKATIDSFMNTGQKIPAIKALREYTGLGLKEAKDIIDNYNTNGSSNVKMNNQPSTNNEAPSNNTSGGGCYIATAVYGSYDCPQVWTLRRYRDNELAKTWYGRAFIRTYYAISPTLVRWFGHTDWFKKMWRGKLDRMVQDLNSNGVENTPYNDIEW